MDIIETVIKKQAEENKQYIESQLYEIFAKYFK